MRRISFALTTPQFKARTKTVTRRLGWRDLQPGDELMAVEKCMGIKKGEKQKELGVIRVVSIRLERLDRMLEPEYGFVETKAEGFEKKLEEFLRRSKKH